MGRPVGRGLQVRLIRVPYGNKVAGTVPADVLFAINEHQGLRPVNIQGSEPPYLCILG